MPALWSLSGYGDYIGIMEKKMEATIMENQMEKKMENEMETGITIWSLSGSCVFLMFFLPGFCVFYESGLSQRLGSFFRPFLRLKG